MGRSTCGRPRKLTDQDVKEILEWHANRKSLRRVARDYGVSPATIQDVIDRNGIYKQPSPEERSVVLQKRQRRVSKLKLEGYV